jgi:uncharacterized protein (UPF0297 family)
MAGQETETKDEYELMDRIIDKIFQLFPKYKPFKNMARRRIKKIPREKIRVAMEEVKKILSS